MPFIEVEKTRLQGMKHGASAAFTVSKKGGGSLRLNAGTMAFLKENGNEWNVGDRVRIFHDTQNGKIALKKSEDGRFRLAKNVSGGNSLRISSKDLTELLKQPAEYTIEQSSEYDLVLVPR